jgi:diguanylate cyclase (GGDEF)-like protein/PAS domain S-box-containing protein
MKPAAFGKLKKRMFFILFRHSIKTWLKPLFDGLAALGVFQKSYTHDFETPNILWENMGYSSKEMTNTLWQRQLHPGDRQWLPNLLEEILEKQNYYELPEYRILTKSGEPRWIVSKGFVVSRDAQDRVHHLIGIDFDITDRKRTEAELKKTQQALEERLTEIDILQKAAAVINSSLEWDKVISNVLEQAQRIVPYDTASVFILNDQQLILVAGSGWEKAEDINGIALPIPGDNPNTAVIEKQTPLIVDNPNSKYPHFSDFGMKDIESWMGIPLIVRSEVIGMITLDGFGENFFTEQHIRSASMLADHIAVALQNARTFEHTHRIAHTDQLTGALTRRSLFIEGRRLFEAALGAKASLAVLMIDIDHFKSFNDQYGHLLGDAVLTEIATACSRELRSQDICGRYGGEEFTALLPDAAGDSAILVAERLRAAVEALKFKDINRSVTISIGLTALDLNFYTYRNAADPITFKSMLEKADQALYCAKNRGRNRVVALPVLKE